VPLTVLYLEGANMYVSIPFWLVIVMSISTLIVAFGIVFVVIACILPEKLSEYED
jgi:hypothetical protein